MIASLVGQIVQSLDLSLRMGRLFIRRQASAVGAVTGVRIGFVPKEVLIMIAAVVIAASRHGRRTVYYPQTKHETVYGCVSDLRRFP